MTIRPELAYRFNQIIWGGLDLLFPPSCCGCGKLGSLFCRDCQQKLESVPLPVCEVCGLPQNKTGICTECEITRPTFFALRSCTVYKDPARPALLSLKFHGKSGLGPAFARIIAPFLDGLGWQADYITPIPISQKRSKERGYNQAELIAYPLARLLGWQFNSSALSRTGHSNSQVGLGAKERRKNVQGVFHAEPHVVNGKTILLVDDIATSGSTLDSASSTLLEAGARKVLALTFARALPKYGYDHDMSLPTHTSL